MTIPKVPKNREKGIEERTIFLYVIGGFFIDPTLFDTPPIAVAFSGHFKYNPSNKKIGDGQLIDSFGPSVIEGKMEDEYLEFDKKYDNRNYKITYKFKKENGIWVGKFNSPEIKGMHPVKALTTLIDKEGFYIMAGKPRSSRDYY